MPLTLSEAEQSQIRDAAVKLQRQFAGQVNTETVERLLYESTDTLGANGSSSMWIPLLAERITRDRLRALTRLESSDPDQPPSVLFLCVHNAGRSQMAAGWMRYFAENRIDVFSGGSEPGDALNSAAVRAMEEVGVDISVEIPQPWSDDVVRASDVVVSMGCGDACPVFPGKRYVDWELDDPAGQPIEEVRVIRDDIKQRVLDLMRDLDVEPRE
jgi:protein-tyrosine-phosphatase